jgi:translocator protein
VGFYESLIKPSWVPPDWAFPAAWFTLWALQAAALLRLLGAVGSRSQRMAILALGSQFLVAILWQAVVFGPGRLLLAAWWLVALLALVVSAVALAWRVDRLAGLLVLPTVCWVSVATALGWALYRLNPTA